LLRWEVWHCILLLLEEDRAIDIPLRERELHLERKTMTFEALNISPAILSALTKCGYTSPTPIQQQTIPLAATGQDIIAKAPTGTGKTAAFVLPALERLIAAKSRHKPRILVLAPTRELATQITDVIYKYGKNIRVNAISILGGMPYREQMRKLSRPSDILVATPGRLIDYMNRGSVDFSDIEMFVLDEADRMLDMGFIHDVEMIAQAMPKQHQTLLFTATMDHKLIKLASRILKTPAQIEIKNKTVTLDAIAQRVYLADDNGHKSRMLHNMLANEGIYKGVIFTSTKRMADQLARDLDNNGLKAAALHGDMNQNRRNRTIAQFREGRVQFLIATDVAARGIDVSDVTHVINYDMPRQAEDYVHRIGRTGRAERSGDAWSLVTAQDRQLLQRIERFTDQSIKRHVIEGLEPRKEHAAAPGKTFARKKTWGGKGFPRGRAAVGQRRSRAN